MGTPSKKQWFPIGQKPNLQPKPTHYPPARRGTGTDRLESGNLFWDWRCIFVFIYTWKPRCYLQFIIFSNLSTLSKQELVVLAVRAVRNYCSYILSLFENNLFGRGHKINKKIWTTNYNQSLIAIEKVPHLPPQIKCYSPQIKCYSFDALGHNSLLTMSNNGTRKALSLLFRVASSLYE